MKNDPYKGKLYDFSLYLSAFPQDGTNCRTTLEVYAAVTEKNLAIKYRAPAT